ncbi:hypothetical protein RM549_12090 [Salegentibacter sp. F188]|uniref:Sperm nuclear basic protein PL-I n=1 Tax=Autumnicola patrickiae TaxID=3075591 RepID=A0ABU3E3G0_9FLAO|nr:hypothetical protein [Salegentibacter sp. F188]MDT0690530.1 hypothetical protein [Salegentibacter sp. F188]
MKNFTLLIAVLFAGWSVSASAGVTPTRAYNDSFIFVEGGVEFAVYPNGEFDFYYNPDFRRTNVVNISTPSTNISYNAGFNYDPYIQYDDYGAVIQIETVPVFYDYYGRIIQAGDVLIDYNNHGQVGRVGNLIVHYNRFNRISHYNGFINNYNRYYIHRPWHSFYTRPHSNMSIVFGNPYRAYYQPHRVSYNQYITYYSNNYRNTSYTKNFYRPNQTVVAYNRGRRVTEQRDVRKEFRNSTTRTENNIAENRRTSTARERTTATDRGSNSRTSSNLENRSRAIEDMRKTRSTSSRIESNSNSRASEARTSNTRRPEASERTIRRNSSPARSSNNVRQSAPVQRSATVRSTNSGRSSATQRTVIRSRSENSNSSPSRRSSARNVRSNN